MKKTSAIILVLTLVLFLLCACAPTDEKESSTQGASSEQSSKPIIHYDIPENSNSDVIIDFVPED